MWIDCTTCRARGSGCETCVIGLLELRPSGSPVGEAGGRADPHFDEQERRAVSVLLRAGLLDRVEVLGSTVPEPAAGDTRRRTA